MNVWALFILSSLITYSREACGGAINTPGQDDGSGKYGLISAIILFWLRLTAQVAQHLISGWMLCWLIYLILSANELRTHYD
jgi:hypothetical protein